MRAHMQWLLISDAPVLIAAAYFMKSVRSRCWRNIRFAATTTTFYTESKVRRGTLRGVIFVLTCAARALRAVASVEPPPSAAAHF
jgi:hypothetical protein